MFCQSVYITSKDIVGKIGKIPELPALGLNLVVYLDSYVHNQSTFWQLGMSIALLFCVAPDSSHPITVNSGLCWE